MKLREIADAVGGRLVGDGEIDIARPVQPHKVTDAGDMPLVFSENALDLVLGSPAVAAFVVRGVAVPDGRLAGIVVVDDPRAALVPLSMLFARRIDIAPGIHPTAVVDATATVARGACIGPCVVVGPGAEIGTGSRILAHVSVGARARLGADCLIYPGVRIGDDVLIGDRVILQPNACIGADGFSFATPDPPKTATIVSEGKAEPYLFSIQRIGSLGTVVLEDDVEVGACSTIDRATIGITRIGRNTKIDNQVMIGHNCIIGENCLLAAQVGVSGSVTVGNRVIMGGKVGVVDHVTIGDDANLGARASIYHDVPPRAIMLGNPAVSSVDYYNKLRHTHLSRLTRAAERLRDLEARVTRLESAKPEKT
jgi:UDP-3-O-[3-hydroxymyristoyl] glucosamine N-acyltransferase